MEVLLEGLFLFLISAIKLLMFATLIMALMLLSALFLATTVIVSAIKRLSLFHFIGSSIKSVALFAGFWLGAIFLSILFYAEMPISSSLLFASICGLIVYSITNKTLFGLIVKRWGKYLALLQLVRKVYRQYYAAR